MRFQNKLYKFMYGRYGIDNLYNFLFYVYIFILIANLFINSNILCWIALLPLTIAFYRFFSKNISKRRKENDMYLKIKNNVLKPYKNLRRNYKDKDMYIYKKCHKCHTILRLPLPPKRGIRHAKCPNCKKRIKILCLRKQKVEVIRKGEVK